MSLAEFPATRRDRRTLLNRKAKATNRGSRLNFHHDIERAVTDHYCQEELESVNLLFGLDFQEIDDLIDWIAEVNFYCHCDPYPTIWRRQLDQYCDQMDYTKRQSFHPDGREVGEWSDDSRDNIRRTVTPDSKFG
jgi:hypothetical protein